MIGRRRALGLGVAAASMVAVVRARAGVQADKSKPGAGLLTVPEYLHRAALLLDETRRALYLILAD